MELSHIAALVYTMTAICYILVANHIIHTPSKTNRHWTFFLIAVSAAVWSVGSAVTSGTDERATAELWQRVASIGYGTTLSFLLHFTLIITGHDILFTKKWIWPLLYGPSLLNILFFALGPTLGIYQYDIVWTSAGWNAISVAAYADLYYYSYVLTYSMATLYVLIRWRIIHAGDPKVLALFRLLFYTISFAVVIGIMTDMVLMDVLGIHSPDFATLLILVPLFSAVFASEKHELFKKGFKRDDMEILQAKVKDSFILMIFALSVPAVVMGGVATASVNIWIYPLLLAIPFMAYSDNRMLIGLSLATVVTMIVTAHSFEETAVVIGNKDHITRFMIFLIGMSLAFIIHRIYRRRLKDNIRQIEVQQMIAEISTHMVGTNEENFDSYLTDVLKKMAVLFGMDRGYYFTFSAHEDTMTYTHEWCAPGVSEQIGTITDIPVDTFPWWMSELKTKGSVYVEDVSKLSEIYLKEELERQEITATMAVAVNVAGRMVGFVGLDYLKKPKPWKDDIRTSTRIIGNVISEAVAKIHAEKTIRRMAYYDQLTGLPTRQLFKDRLQLAIRNSDREGHKVMVAMLDLDSFKSINDSLGHDKGDQLLQDVAKRLERSVRQSDTVCRFGGDEFLILCSDLIEEKDAQRIGEDVFKGLREVFVLDGENFNITVSMGIAMYPDNGTDPDKLIKNADIAMYHSKTMGKNRFAVCNEKLKEETQHRSELINSMYRAIEKEQFSMVYQPQVDLMTGDIIGVEALIRWHHEQFGNVAPGEFIRLAERNGYIIEIGEWVMRQVFGQMVRWSSEGHNDFEVAINVSFIQLKHPGFVDNIHKMIDTYTVDPSRVVLEITESIAMTDRIDIRDRLNDLKALGITVAIDDFGTDYSSMGRLKELTVDKIKIARPFINGINNQKKDEAIIRSIISLAKNLEMTAIAEGVEKEEQKAFLIEEHCDHVQGFYYYEPMTAEEISRLLDMEDIH